MWTHRALVSQPYHFFLDKEMEVRGLRWLTQSHTAGYCDSMMIRSPGSLSSTPSLSVALLWPISKKEHFAWKSMDSPTTLQECESWLFYLISAWPSVQFSSVQSLSRVRLFATPWTTAHQASLSITNSLNSLCLSISISNIQQICYYYIIIISFQVVLVVKNPPANAEDIGDTGSVPGSGRSPGVGNGNPLQYSYLENPMDRGA